MRCKIAGVGFYDFFYSNMIFCTLIPYDVRFSHFFVFFFVYALRFYVVVSLRPRSCVSNNYNISWAFSESLMKSLFSQFKFYCSEVCLSHSHHNGGLSNQSGGVRWEHRIAQCPTRTIIEPMLSHALDNKIIAPAEMA